MPRVPQWVRRLPTRMARDFSSLLRAGALNAALVRISWDVRSAAVVAGNPLFESSRPAPTSRSERTFRAFVHFVQPIESGVNRQYEEVESGDVILDFEATESLDGLLNLRWEVPAGSGMFYVQKRAGKALSRNWELVMGHLTAANGNVRRGRTVLLTLEK